MTTDEFSAQKSILEREACLFSLYLLDQNPPKSIIERYAEANRKLGIASVPVSDINVIKFIHAHPWSIPFLDAASGLIQPSALLRKKIYTMAAALEASTLFTEAFLPRPLPTFTLCYRLLANGMLAGMKIIIGVPILLFIRRRIHD